MKRCVMYWSNFVRYAGFQIYKNLDTEFQKLKGDEAVIAGIRKMAAEMEEEK